MRNFLIRSNEFWIDTILVYLRVSVLVLPYLGINSTQLVRATYKPNEEVGAHGRNVNICGFIKNQAILNSA